MNRIYCNVLSVYVVCSCNVRKICKNDAATPSILLQDLKITQCADNTPLQILFHLVYNAKNWAPHDLDNASLNCLHEIFMKPDIYEM